ncbi:MAG: fibronectin type III domain-containing protein [bacterium]
MAERIVPLVQWLFLCTTFAFAQNQTITRAAKGPIAVPTFHCLGIYWTPADGGRNNACQVKYRRVNGPAWKEALPLWFDERNHEYRGSIVNLEPGTTYEIELRLQATGTAVTFVASTWNEKFPIAKTVYLPKASHSTFVVSQSGSSNGYILYAPLEGASATIDVSDDAETCIEVQPNVAHVILRGLILKGAREHGIRLNEGVHDIVIEECDISGWGTNETEGWGVNYHSAVYAGSKSAVRRIIVQRNKMHHPRSMANSWAEFRLAHATYHPRGPQAVAFFNSKGNHVIRYNEIYSDDEHYFNDALGYGSNFSTQGFPNCDSDIYGNLISHCWDDGIESEGANRNVRIWGNYLDKCFVKLAIACTSVGPLYIWRNIANTSRKIAGEPNSDHYGRGRFIKAGGRNRNGVWYGSGRTYIFHNTVLQPPPPRGQLYPLGCDGGIIASGGELYEVMSRNNILTNYKNGHATFRDKANSCTNDFDYDLYTGNLDAQCSSRPHQSHGIKASPIFADNNGPGEFALARGTPGFDAGVILPNFNDSYHGNAPDIGAFEASSPPMEFGVNTSR